jgi:hypothetical protein
VVNEQHLILPEDRKGDFGEPSPTLGPKLREDIFVTFPAPSSRVVPVQPVQAYIFQLAMMAVNNLKVNIPKDDPGNWASGSNFDLNIGSFGGSTYSSCTRL